MSRQHRTIAFALAVAVAAVLAFSKYGIIGLAHETTQLYLSQLGASVYEFHSQHGRWPASIDRRP